MYITVVTWPCRLFVPKLTAADQIPALASHLQLAADSADHASSLNLFARAVLLKRCLLLSNYQPKAVTTATVQIDRSTKGSKQYCKACARRLEDLQLVLILTVPSAI